MTPQAVVIEVLRRLPEVRRAWLLRQDASQQLAFETEPGLELALGARMARLLQNSLGGVWDGFPLRVVFLSGSRLVARRIGGTLPLYVCDAAQDRDQPAGSTHGLAAASVQPQPIG